MQALISLGVTSVIAAVMASTAQAAPGDKIDGSYICVFEASAVAKGNVRAEANRAANAAGGSVRHVYENALRGFAASMSANAVQQLRSRNPHIAYCEQDQEVWAIQSGPLDFRVVGKPVAPAPAQTTPWGVTRVKGGAGTGTANGLAWVLDTGIDLDHPDLNVDEGLSRSFTREQSADDLNGHGSHVAGTIAAKDNTIGVVGVTPGATLVAVKVLTRNGSGSNSGVIAGVDYVAGAAGGNGVANMSLTGGISQALDSAVIGAASTGVKFTLAAGNDADTATNYSPARANHANIYTVSSFAKGTSATDTDDPWSGFSNFGNPPVDFAEPGSSIPSTYKDGRYATASGTSMAAPHLAGILLTKATPISDGTVDGDPDGSPDTIGTK